MFFLKPSNWCEKSGKTAGSCHQRHIQIAKAIMLIFGMWTGFWGSKTAYIQANRTLKFDMWLGCEI